MKTYNELYSIYSPDASFEPYIVIPNERDGNYYFAVILRREYCGVPFKCCAVSKETDEVQSKPMFYLCYFYGKEKLTAMINTTGFEDIINPKQITDKVLPVTSALDILDKELAPNINLQIDDVSLVYYNSFDASKYAVYPAPTATAARTFCPRLPLTAHGHCPAKYDILDMARQ